MPDRQVPLRMPGEEPRPITVYELWIWLDTLMRFHGFDLPFLLEGSGMLLDCRVGRVAGGVRAVKLLGTSVAAPAQGEDS